MKSNNRITTRIFIFFAVVFLLLAGGVFWWRDAMHSADPTDTKVILFSVPSGEGAKEISRQLSTEGLIRSQIGFYILMRFGSYNQKLQAGDFRLSRSMDARTIAEALTHGMSDVWITIPEGWRDEEIATEVAKSIGIPEQQFLTLAKEGYMFPDTYSIPSDATASAIVNMFLTNFQKKITPQLIADAKKNGLTENQLVTLASLVEKEGKNAQDRPMIAGIILNRLKKDWPLQIDATLQYSLGYQAKEKTWWKKDLTDADKKIDDPYNTYLNTGLPPGPIANPGLDSIAAAAHPTMSDYMYYIHDTSGVAHYAKTIEEHEANVSKYLSQ